MEVSSFGYFNFLFIYTGILLLSLWQDLKDFARTAGNVHYAEVSRSDPNEG